ncbi:FAD dependent oxidoreductase [bacterium A37T11]|nr:FAD dependent oxidoreductase [bacterium A37T11]
MIKSILKKIFLYLTIFLIVSGTAEAQKVKSYDVVIYGGGSAGFIAAIQTAKLHKSVALLEPTLHVGGINVEGLGGTDIDNHPEFQNSPAVGGLALEFYRRIAKEYGYLDSFDNALTHKLKRPKLWRFEPHVAEKVINDWLGEFSIDIFKLEKLSEGPNAVKKEGKRITVLKTESGNKFLAKVFIDASLEGDLLAAAGISTIVGREANELYGESRNGIRSETTHSQFTVKVDPYLKEGDANSGLIHTIQNEPLGVPGSGDRRIQAYCFRMCLTQNPDNKISFSRPKAYDRSSYEIYLRYIRAGGKLYRPEVTIPGGKTDLGAWHDLSHNLYGLNFDYPEVNYKKRDEILDYHRNFTQGLFYFLSNDSEVKKLDSGLQKAWASWGLAKDEFTDNNGWPRQFYVRDARRMVSDYVITEHQLKKEGAEPVLDPVALAFWPPDLHNARRIVINGAAYNEGAVFGGDCWKPFGISYRSIVPKKFECTNLLAPTCPSSSHIAYGAIRIEFTFMALGQAAADAAVAAIINRQDVQEVAYGELKQKLLSQGQVLSYL